MIEIIATEEQVLSIPESRKGWRCYRLDYEGADIGSGYIWISPRGAINNVIRAMMGEKSCPTADQT